MLFLKYLHNFEYKKSFPDSLPAYLMDKILLPTIIPRKPAGPRTFISIGYIIKGYFYGKQNTLPHMVSNVVEQLFRLLIILTFNLLLTLEKTSL